MKFKMINLELSNNEIQDIFDKAYKKSITCVESDHRLLPLKDIIKGEEIRNISDQLDSFNITFELLGVNMLQYTIISTFRNILINVLDKDYAMFKTINLESEELNDEYNKLLAECLLIRSMLKDKYGFSDDLIEYIEPMTQLVDLRISMTTREFLRFVNTCSKYDELIDIVIALYDIDELNLLLSRRTELATQKDLFMRYLIDNVTRDYIIDNKLYVLSNMEHVKRSIDFGYNVKVSSLGFGSYIAFREIATSLPNFNIKLENPKHVENNGTIPIVVKIANEYSDLGDEDKKIIDKYIYRWICLINRFHLETEVFDERALLCHLGCFGTVFRMNNELKEYNPYPIRLNKEAEVILDKMLEI